MPGGNVRYAQNGGVNIAYDVIGDGPRDVVFVCGTMSHLELWWSDPDATEMLERLSRFARVILFDKPGTGLSDPIPATPTVEQRADDIVAVLDAVGSERAVVIGYSEGGFAAALLAATRPERVESLVLVSTTATSEHFDRCPVGPEWFASIWETVGDAWRHWGEGRLLTALAPTWAAGPQLALLGPIERTCMSPGMARSVLEGMHDIDLRDVVPTIRVPTLVLHSPDETWFPVEMGRDLAARIPGARFVPLVGPDHLFWIHNAARVPDAVEEFVTRAAPGPDDHDRVLATGGWPASTGRPGRCGSPPPWSTRRRSWASRSGRGCTPASAKPWAGTCSGSPS